MAHASAIEKQVVKKPNIRLLGLVDDRKAWLPERNNKWDITRNDPFPYVLTSSTWHHPYWIPKKHKYMRFNDPKYKPRSRLAKYALVFWNGTTFRNWKQLGPYGGVTKQTLSVPGFTAAFRPIRFVMRKESAYLVDDGLYMVNIRPTRWEHRLTKKSMRKLEEREIAKLAKGMRKRAAKIAQRADPRTGLVPGEPHLRVIYHPVPTSHFDVVVIVKKNKIEVLIGRALAYGGLKFIAPKKLMRKGLVDKRKYRAVGILAEHPIGFRIFFYFPDINVIYFNPNINPIYGPQTDLLGKDISFFDEYQKVMKIIWRNKTKFARYLLFYYNKKYYKYRKRKWIEFFSWELMRTRPGTLIQMAFLPAPSGYDGYSYYLIYTTPLHIAVDMHWPNMVVRAVKMLREVLKPEFLCAVIVELGPKRYLYIRKVLVERGIFDEVIPPPNRIIDDIYHMGVKFLYDFYKMKLEGTMTLREIKEALNDRLKTLKAIARRSGKKRLLKKLEMIKPADPDLGTSWKLPTDHLKLPGEA